MLARLRELNGGWPRVDAVVITHWHLDHWGDLVPWVWGRMVGPGKRDGRSPSSGCRPGGRDMLATSATRLGWEEMFESTFDVRDYDEADSVQTAAGLEVVADPAPALHAARRTASASRTAIARSRTRATAGPTTGSRTSRVTPTSSSARRRCSAASSTAARAATCRCDEAVEAFDASGAKRLLLTHRPDELPAPDGWELAYDGLQISL